MLAKQHKTLLWFIFLYYLLFVQKFTHKILIMNKQLILFSTAHCHLCEMAQALVLQATSEIDLTVIDIADNDDLLADFGVRIPVLQKPDKSELGWPFNAEDVLKFLNIKF